MTYTREQIVQAIKKVFTIDQFSHTYTMPNGSILPIAGTDTINQNTLIDDFFRALDTPDII